jgi:uncharacterized protein (UPF0335 family)
MKHLKLFEAFESNILSKTLSYLSDDSKKDFMNKISKFCTKIDFPKSKLTDDYFKYLPYNTALKMFISSEDKLEDCKAKSEEVFGEKGIKDDICTGGKLKRTWGKSSRNVDCPKCLGTGKIKVGNSDAPEGYELIKFWINAKKDIVNTTITDGKASKSYDKDGYVGYGDIYLGENGNSRRSGDLSQIPHLSEVIIKWWPTDEPYLATIFHERRDTYVIHDNSRKDGGTPDDRNWRKYGRHSWDLGGYDFHTIQMAKPNEDGELNYYLYNKLTDSELKSTNRVSSQNSLGDSQFAIVFDTGKLKKSEYTKRTEIIKGRSELRKGLVGGRLGLSNDAINKQNLDKYIKALATKDIKGDVSDLQSLDNYIFRILGGKNVIFKMLKGETGDVVKVIEGFFKMLKVNEEYGYNDWDYTSSRSDKIKEWYRDELVKFINSREGKRYRDDINREYSNLQSERGMSEYDTLEFLYNKYIKGVNLTVGDDKTIGIKTTLITLFERSIKENQRINNEVKSFLNNPRISAFDKQILRSVLSVSELIYEKLKSFGKIENLMDAELILQKIKTINDVITNSRWDFYDYIKGKKDVFDFKSSGTRTKEGGDKFRSKLSTSVEEIKNLINKI